MIISRKRAAIEKLISGYDKAMILKDINDIITEIKAGKWPDNTRLFAIGFAPVSVGMVKQIPNWETNAVVLQNMSSALIGRFMRAVFEQVGAVADYSNERDCQFVHKIAVSTDAAQEAACAALIGADNYKYFKEHEHEVTVDLIETMVHHESGRNQTKH